MSYFPFVRTPRSPFAGNRGRISLKMILVSKLDGSRKETSAFPSGERMLRGGFRRQGRGPAAVEDSTRISSESPSSPGGHFTSCFSGETKTRKFPAGDIKGNGYVVYPPSTVDGHEYRFVPGRESGADLLPFPESLFPSCDSQVTHLTHRTREEIRRLDAYLAKIESKQGQHGSHGLVRAASVCRDAGLSESEATIKMLEWNSGPTVCPPWNHAARWRRGDYEESFRKEKCNVRKCSRPGAAPERA